MNGDFIFRVCSCILIALNVLTVCVGITLEMIWAKEIKKKRLKGVSE